MKQPLIPHRAIASTLLLPRHPPRISHHKPLPQMSSPSAAASQPSTSQEGEAAASSSSSAITSTAAAAAGGGDATSDAVVTTSTSKKTERTEVGEVAAAGKKKFRRFNKDGEEIVDAPYALSARKSTVDKAIRERIESKMGLPDLKLPNTREKIGVTKPRTHVNPLTMANQAPIEPPTLEYWKKTYANPLLPLFIDVGCAGGRFGVCAAQHARWKDWNHLGLEIRAPLVTRANLWVEDLGLRNVHYFSANANTSLEPIVRNYPGPITMVSIQFPDPHFKRKHHKRRVLTKEFLEILTKVLTPGAQLFMQSDVEEVAAQMRDRTDVYMSPPFIRDGGEYTPRDPALDPRLCAEGKTEECWSADGKRILKGAGSESPKDFGDFLKNNANPIEVPTEREVQNEALGCPIYRMLYRFEPTSITSSQASTTTNTTAAASSSS